MVEYTALNVLTFIVGLSFLLNGYRIVRRGREAILLFGMSAIVGTGLIVVAIFPNIFEIIASLMGLEFKERTVLVFANLTLFVLLTYLFHRIGQLYESISRLNEEVSLLRTDLEETDD